MSRIHGKRLRLRAIERADVANFYEWVNDPEVTFGLSLYLPMSSLDEERWFETIGQRDPHERPMAIDVRDGETWRLIGNCVVFGIDWINRCAEVAIMIGDRSAWDKGYGTEAMMLLAKHCFETLNLQRVFLRVYADNLRAQRAYQKAGFVEEGRLRQAVFKRGAYQDAILMSVLRTEWSAHSKEN
jgi:RimJ/RimL family protein N-acetyltransferase